MTFNTSQNNQDELLTIRECVQLWRVSEKRLRDAIMCGDVPHVMGVNTNRRLGSWDRPVKHVRRSDLEAWIQRNGGAEMRKKA